MNGRLLSVDEVAAYMGVHRDTVYNLIRSGRLPALQMGGRKAGWRITQQDLEEFVQAAKNNTAAQSKRDQYALADFDRRQADELQSFRDGQDRQRKQFLTNQPTDQHD